VECNRLPQSPAKRYKRTAYTTHSQKIKDVTAFVLNIDPISWEASMPVYAADRSTLTAAPLQEDHSRLPPSTGSIIMKAAVGHKKEGRGVMTPTLLLRSFLLVLI
jgi:hypothetical protein